MNTPDSLNTESKNLFKLISKNWEELDDSLKTKLKKLADPIRNKAEKSNPQLPAQIELTVLTTPPKYFSRKIG